MSYQSDKVKRWRRRTKQRMIDSMGGSCVICGYSKCHSSLSFHHLEPSTKDFGFGQLRANASAWSTLVAELKKCILVCNNCHGEIHEGLVQVPKDVVRFDEKFTIYREDMIEVLDSCPICGKLKNDKRITCSLKCSSKSRMKVDWSQHNLVKMKETKSIVQIAKEIGVSDAAIRKRLKKYYT